MAVWRCVRAQLPPPGIPVTQWVWLADNNAPGDEAMMTATILTLPPGQTLTVGQNVFHAGASPPGCALRSTPLAFAGRPLTLHFLGVNGNAAVYLNGASHWTVMAVHRSAV